MYKKILQGCIPLFIIVLFVSSIACNKYQDGGKIELTGRLALIGNEPFAVLALQTQDNKQVRLMRKYRQKFRQYIGLKITLSGIFKIKKIKSIDGKKTFLEYYLKQPVLYTKKK